MVATLQSFGNHLAAGEGRAAVRAAVLERSGLAARIAVKDDLVVADGAREQLAALHLVRPCGDIPVVADEHASLLVR
jgi:hypothetical protein